MTTAAVAGPGAGGPGVPPEVLRAALEPCLGPHAHPELSGAERQTALHFAARPERDGLSFTVTALSPVLTPDPDIAAAVREAHRGLLGGRRVLPWQPGTAAEDSGRFGPAGAELHGADRVRTAYWILGVTAARQWRAAARAGPGGAVPANDAPESAPDARHALPTGIAAMTRAALHVLDVPEGEAF